jgi:hypothetical protein
MYISVIQGREEAHFSVLHCVFSKFPIDTKVSIGKCLHLRSMRGVDDILSSPFGCFGQPPRTHIALLRKNVQELRYGTNLKIIFCG